MLTGKFWDAHPFLGHFQNAHQKEKNQNQKREFPHLKIYLSVIQKFISKLPIFFSTRYRSSENPRLYIHEGLLSFEVMR